MEREEPAGFPAVRWGLTFGIFLVALGLLPLLWLLANGYRLPLDQKETAILLQHQAALVGEYAICNVTASLALYVLAGLMTARDTGTVKPGMFAAVVAFMASDLVTMLVNLVTLKQSEESALSAFGYLADQVRGAFALGYAVSTMCNLVVGVVVVSLIGALGALLGCAIFGRASYT